MRNFISSGIYIVDALLPVSVVPGAPFAVALVSFAIFSEVVSAPALTVPLKTSVFEASFLASCETGFPVAGFEETFSVWEITAAGVFVASDERSLFFFFGRSRCGLCHSLRSAHGVDALFPISELLGTLLAVAIFSFAVTPVVVTAEALSVPLQTGEFKSGGFASFEAGFSVVLLSDTVSEVRHTVWKVTCTLVLVASNKRGIRDVNVFFDNNRGGGLLLGVGGGLFVVVGCFRAVGGL